MMLSVHVRVLAAAECDWLCIGVSGLSASEALGVYLSSRDTMRFIASPSSYRRSVYSTLDADVLSPLGNASSSSEKSPLSGLGFLKSLEKKQTKGTSCYLPALVCKADISHRWPDTEAERPKA